MKKSTKTKYIGYTLVSPYMEKSISCGLDRIDALRKFLSPRWGVEWELENVSYRMLDYYQVEVLMVDFPQIWQVKE